MLKAKLPLLIQNNIPTVDIYFYEPLKAFITTWQGQSKKKPIRRLGPNCFYANNRAVIVRYATRAELEVIGTLNPEHCFYVIDDDLWSMDTDASLPEAYRRYLAPFRQRILPEILELADSVVAPNAQILRLFPDKQCLLLDPSYSSLCSDFSHFDDPQQIDIIFTGSHTHLADLEFISQMLSDLCGRYDNVTLTTFLGRHAPECLRNQKNVIHYREKSWHSYKRFMKRERFHIALSPYRDTPFNRARSINKLFDHAGFGAAGIYSKLPPLSSVIDEGKNGMLIEERAEDWRKAVLHLVERPSQARRLALAGQNLATRLGDPDRIVQFWSRHLDL